MPTTASKAELAFEQHGAVDDARTKLDRATGQPLPGGTVPTTASKAELAFEQYGPVCEARTELDRATGRRFRVVTFEREIDARSAMKALGGAQLDGRTVRIPIGEE